VAEAFGRFTGLGTLAGRRLGELTASGWACHCDAAKAALQYAPQWTHTRGIPTAVAAMQAAGDLAQRIDTSME
jgi:predicted CxxxxCH...CXXCH cytochrome family protein